MLKLLELRFSGIGRFVEEQVIDFKNLGNLVQVDGIRTDTKGSSGSGKTTVFNALDYLFGINSIPNTVLQSRFTKEGISVTGTFTLNDRPLTISRGKTLSVNLDGKITSGSKLAEEVIDEILAMPRELFRKILHKRQKEGGFFLQLTPAKTFEFLTDALGLSDVRKKAEVVDKKIKELTEKSDQAHNQAEKSKAALSAVQNAMSALGMAPVKDIHQEVIVTLKNNYDAAMADLEPIRTKHNLETQAIELTRPELKSANLDDSAIKAAEAAILSIAAEQKAAGDKHMAAMAEERARANKHSAQIQAHRVSLSSLRYDVQTAVTAKSEATKLALEIKKIRESVCPTCENGWATEAAKKRESELLQKINNLKDLVAKGAKSEQEIAHITSQIEQLTPLAIEQSIALGPEHAELEEKYRVQRNIISAERARAMDYATQQHLANKVALDQFAISLRMLTDRHSAELQQVNGQIDLTRRAFESAAQKLKSYEESRVRYETQSNILKNQEAQIQLDIDVAIKKHKTYLSELEMAEEVKKLLKSYLSCSFDDALECIGDTATRIIRAIPNMANATLQLEGIRETKDGKIKEEVNAVIHMDGEEAVPIKSLSGGERSSVDLAIDLGVIDLLENKTGKGIDIFILDEPFTGLDTVSVEMALDVLKNSNLNKRLVIVDHNPIIKEVIGNSVIMVNRDGQNSNISIT